MAVAALSPNPCLAPRPTLSSSPTSGLGEVIVTSTSMDSHSSSWVLAPSLPATPATMLGMLTKTLGELLMVKRVHLWGAHLVHTTDRR